VVVGTVGICLLSYPKIAEMDTLTDVVVEGKKEKEEEREEDNALVTSVFPVCVCVCVCVEGGGEGGGHAAHRALCRSSRWFRELPRL